MQSKPQWKSPQTPTIKYQPSLRTPILSQIFGNLELLRGSSEHNHANHKGVSLLVVSVVDFILTGNKKACDLASKDTKFLNFVASVLSQTNSSSSILLLSLFYMKKLSTRVSLKGAQGSEYRIWLTSLILADVFLNDNAFLIQSWSTVSGLKSQEIVAMRREFLTGLRFDLMPKESDYVSWVSDIEEFVAGSYSHFMPLLLAPSSQPLTPPLSPPQFYV
jgi:hypothetical protein